MTQQEQLLVIADFYKLHPIEIIRQLIDIRYIQVLEHLDQLKNLQDKDD